MHLNNCNLRPFRSNGLKTLRSEYTSSLIKVGICFYEENVLPYVFKGLCIGNF